MVLTGLFGYYPLVDRVNNYYMQVVQTKLVVMISQIQRLGHYYIQAHPFTPKSP